jgi:hypothetical protein
MKLALFTLISLLPLCGKAQTPPKGFEHGYYTLADEPTVRHTGWVRIQPFAPSLQVQGEGKTITKYKPAQLVACGTDGVTYEVARDFLSGRMRIDAGFAERLDSGQVVLLHHSRISGTGTGALIYLVRRSTETAVTVLDVFGNQFREQVLPFIASRPDLVQAVQAKKVKYEDLYALIHALNTGQPYSLKK